MWGWSSFESLQVQIFITATFIINWCSGDSHLKSSSYTLGLLKKNHLFSLKGMRESNLHYVLVSKDVNKIHATRKYATFILPFSPTCLGGESWHRPIVHPYQNFLNLDYHPPTLPMTLYYTYHWDTTFSNLSHAAAALLEVPQVHTTCMLVGHLAITIQTNSIV